MNKLSPFHLVAISLVASAAILISKSNNRYPIREAVLRAADAFLDVEGGRRWDSEET